MTGLRVRAPDMRAGAALALPLAAGDRRPAAGRILAQSPCAHVLAGEGTP